MSIINTHDIRFIKLRWMSKDLYSLLTYYSFTKFNKNNLNIITDSIIDLQLLWLTWFKGKRITLYIQQLYNIYINIFTNINTNFIETNNPTPDLIKHLYYYTDLRVHNLVIDLIDHHNLQSLNEYQLNKMKSLLYTREYNLWNNEATRFKNIKLMKKDTESDPTPESSEITTSSPTPSTSGTTPDVQSTSPSAASVSTRRGGFFSFLSLKSRATPRDRGSEEGGDTSGMKSSTGPQVEPAADLREAKGEVIKRADGRTTSGLDGKDSSTGPQVDVEGVLMQWKEDRLRLCDEVYSSHECRTVIEDTVVDFLLLLNKSTSKNIIDDLFHHIQEHLLDHPLYITPADNNSFYSNISKYFIYIFGEWIRYNCIPLNKDVLKIILKLYIK